MEILKTILLGSLVLAFIYLTLSGMLSYLRELRSKRYGRLEFYGPLAIMALTIGSCVATEQVTGTPWGTEPDSFFLRRAFFGVAIVAFVALGWWIKRLESGSSGGDNPWLASVSERRAFVAGKVCPACNQPMEAKRLVQAVNAETNEALTGRIYRCQCGELTLFEPDGHARHVEDRTR